MGKRGEKRERRSAILEPDAAGIENSNEPKCAFANTPHNSASNSYPSQQIQQLRKLVPEESGFRQLRGHQALRRAKFPITPFELNRWRGGRCICGRD